MRVRVRLFALLAERAGQREMVVELPDGATARDLWEALPDRVRQVGFGLESLRVAVNLQYTGWDRVLADDDEVALIPPVAGGNGAASPPAVASPVRVVLTTEPLSPEHAIAALIDPQAGAIAVFVGTVREWTGSRRTLQIHYEAYDRMAEEEMRRIGEEVVRACPQARIVLAHRVGLLHPGDISLVIAVATPHRAAAFDALRRATEELKRRVPIWKKERYDDGEEWVGMGA